ncbi:MAG: hypothetical protein R3F07_01930 [Opitutaceae bacterium]
MIFRNLLGGIVLLTLVVPVDAVEIRLVVEETIETVPSPHNGASPLWCYGSTILVRDGSELYLSLLRPDEGYPPYCNAHWELWRRDSGVWSELHRGGEAREREPCPIGLLAKGEVVLSIQPAIMPKPFQDGHGDVPWVCQPGLFTINTGESGHEDRVYTDLHPVFPVGARFSQHSYRGLGVDRANRELLLMVIEQTDEHYQPTWLDRNGQWHPLPLLEFPIRSCYPQVALKDGAAHVLAIGDIVEPVEAWRRAKFEVLNREWDYAFRRLFYSWSSDLETNGFVEPIEIDSVDETAGSMRNLDLFIDGNGRAHLLYLKQNHQYAFMRDRFFPGQPMTVSIEYAVVDQGQVILRQTLFSGSAEEGGATDQDSMKLHLGRFHPLPDGHLGVVTSGSWRGGESRVESGLFLSLLSDEGTVEQTIRLPAKRPFTGAFFTNTPRSGSDAGRHLDLIGAFSEADSHEMRYLGYELTK